MDELSEDQLRELEEKLYSQVHHQDSTQSTFSVDNHETQNQIGFNKFLSNRYWVNGKNDTTKAPPIAVEQQQNGTNINPEFVEQNTNQNTATKMQKKDKYKGKKVRNPFATQKQQKQQNRNNRRSQQNKAHHGGPFVRQAERLQRVAQYEIKKQKSKNARENMAKRPLVIDTVVLDSSDGDGSDEDVIVIPLPPVPVYDVEESDEEEVPRKSDSEETEMTTDTAKNDAFITPKSKKSTLPTDIVSRSNSPNSVMSQDDFIGQNDRQRLTKSGTTLTDAAELQLLSNSTDSLLEPPTPPHSKKNTETASNDIECIGTFIKPTITNKKQSYRVDQNGFRAIDVYESESDIVSDGVYSKGMAKTQPPTTIRNLDRSSGSDEDPATSLQSKTKRLRKRRASGSYKGSESNGGGDSSDTDEGDGVEATGIPFISRGPAVENCKSKRFRKRTLSHGSKSGNMLDTEFMATLNSLAQGNDKENEKIIETDDDSETENLPTARDIAETVINQEQGMTATPNRRGERLTSDRSSTPNAKKSLNSIEAVPADIADDIEKLFDQINDINAKKAIEISDDEEDCEKSTVSHTDPASDVSAAIAEQSVPVEKDNNADNKIVYFIAHRPANNSCISDGFGWDEEMRRFYNYSWGGEHAREEDILRHMNRDKRFWVISDADRMMARSRRDRREKCLNCCSFGHTRAKCTKPRKPLVCYMCGESGHQESRCPNTRCLRCGSKTNFFSQSCKKCLYWNNRICPICKLRGHSLNDCPDKWRRYHSTTRSNVFPNSRVIYNKRRFCCFCGRKGHLSDDCNKSYFRSEYPIICSEIKSHEKSYEDVILKSNRSAEIPCRLLFDPNTNYNFGLGAKTTHKQVYGRFLSAVGLEHLIGKKNELPKSNPAKRPKKNTNTQTELEEPSCSTIITPEQVPEISESTNNISVEATASLQMPPPRITTHPLRNTLTEPMDHDSDSNYSFSDHFEGPTSSSTACAKSEPLPDFISFNDTSKSLKKFSEMPVEESEQLDKNKKPKFGISAKYVVSYSDDEDGNLMKTSEANDATNVIDPPDIPCDAKIYVSNKHGQYFTSKLGEEYLNKALMDNNLTGHLDKTIVGYALFMHGLPTNQEKLQRELEEKFKILNDTRSQQYAEIPKTPKNVGALTCVLRDHITQLYGKLGNPSDLCKRLVDLNMHSSKASIKMADRIRKKLNMIFLGQAGLFYGDKHIETLLKGLQTLMNDYKPHEKVSNDLKKNIDHSFRILFTPNHQNYPELLISYMKLPLGSRNRIPQLQIDPSLMGQFKFKITMSDEQKVRYNNGLEQCEKVAPTNIPTIEADSLLLNVITIEKSQNLDNNQTESRENLKNSDKKPQDINSNECKIDEKKTTIIERLNNKHSQELLSQIAMSPKREEKGRASVIKDSTQPSEFWSRESQIIIQKLIDLADAYKVTTPKTTLERLHRINKKAIAGGLSYNDYRFVIELYNVTIKINKK